MNAIEVKDITKSFRIYPDKGSQLKEKLLFRKRNRHEVRQVLKGISFTVEKGCSLGLIGHNGCGKSTTLKLLTKIIYPDSGEIKINGRVSSLLELGAGFHPDMTGRENIYTNASIFGLTKKETDARIRDIIDFSELGEFIDDPVRTYSSGMYMRLAFAVAINVDADILLIDEILAVGDANFQTKCFDRLRELKAEGTSMILVTHDLSSVEKFCDRAIWLNDGVICREGKAAEVVDAYYSFMNRRKAENSAPVPAVEEAPPAEENPPAPADDADEMDYSANRFGMRYIEITSVCMRDASGKDTRIFTTGDSLSIEINYKVNRPLDEYVFGFGFYTIEGACLYGNNTQLDRLKISPGTDTGTVAVDIPHLPLLAGKYALNAAIVDKDGTPMDFYRKYCSFEVVSDDRSEGYISIDHKWRTIR